MTVSSLRSKDSLQPRPLEKLPLGGKILYGLGDSTFSLMFTTISFFFLFFLTDGIGLNAVLAGWVLFAGRIWDALSDPLVGYFSDRTRNRWGRRRPFLLFGAVPLAASYILLWQRYPLQNQFALVALYALLVVLFFTAFTVSAVPYAAMIPELTLDYDDRTSLVSFRMCFSIIFSLVGAALPMFFVETIGGDIVKGFRNMAFLFGLLGVIPILLTFLGTRERFSREGGATLSIRKAYRETLKNKPFRLAMLIFLLSWVTLDIIGVVFVYFVSYYLGRQGLIDTLLLTLFLSAVLFLPFWYWVSKRLGKRGAYLIGISFWALVMLLLILLPRDASIWLLMVMAALAGIGVSTAHVIPWSLIPECVDYDELKTGARREGMYTGFLTFLQKLASSLAVLLVGSVLGISGYRPGLDQSAPTLLAIRLLLGPLPGCLLLCSMILTHFYPITKKKHGQIRNRLERMKSLSARALDAEPKA